MLRGASRIGRFPTMNSSIASSTWQALIEHHRALRGRALTTLFDALPERFGLMSLVWVFSKSHGPMGEHNT
jgi:hypothetical protein